MHEHQRVHGTVCDEPCADHSLAESSSCGEYARLVGEHGFCSDFLLWAQFTLKRNIQRVPPETLIAQDIRDLQVRKQVTDILQAATRQSESVRIIPCTANDPGSVVGRSTHCLRSVEFGVLKGCQPDETVAKSRRQEIFGNEYLATQNQLQFFRQRTSYRSFPPARLRSEPGKGIAFLLLARVKTLSDDTPFSFRVADTLFDFDTADSANLRQKSPLIFIGREVAVEKQTVA
jgi:hypothetical protein